MGKERVRLVSNWFGGIRCEMTGADCNRIGRRGMGMQLEITVGGTSKGSCAGTSASNHLCRVAILGALRFVFERAAATDVLSHRNLRG